MVKRIALLVAVWLQVQGAFAQTITTVAGTGASGNAADPQPAATATLNFPVGIVVDSAGDVYFADASSHRVRKLTVATGVISTVLGTTLPGNDAASLASPVAVALDAAGDLYVADSLNSRIQKRAAASGTVTTVAGTGSQGNPGADGTAATSSPMHTPRGVAVDGAGNVYYSDSENHVVRKVTPAGIVSTVAGTFVQPGPDRGGCSLTQLRFPRGLAATSSGEVFIADSGNNRILLLSGGVLSVFAGDAACSAGSDDAAAANARFSFPAAVAIASNNDVLIADSGNSRIRRVRLGTVTTVAGTTQGFSGDAGPATSAQLNMARGVAPVPGSEAFYISDLFNNRIRKVAVSAPTAPVLDTATPANGQVSLAFTPAYDGGSPVTSFTASCAPGPVTQAGTASPIVVTGLTNDTEYTCSVTATNAVGTSAASNTKVATPGIAPVMTSTAPPGGTVGVTYTHIYTASGTPSPTFILLNGTLPAGLVLATSGALSGTPTEAGTFTGTVSATNGIQPTGDQAFSIAIAKGAQAITFAALPDRALGTGPYTLSATGGASTSPVVFTSTTPGTCTTTGTNGATLTLVAVGTCSVTASQAADANYNEASNVARSFTIVLLPSSLSLSATAIDFGGQSMNTTSPARAITVTNTSSDPLLVTSVTSNEGQFSATHNCANVAAGATCTVNVFFSPAVQAGIPLNGAVGLAGSLSIASNATGSPHAVSLAGSAEKSLVTHYYRSILRRDPDSGGKTFWSNEAQRIAGTLGANVNEAWFALAQAFYFSPEYAAFSRNPTEYVTDLYNTFFNRPPDSGGLDYWTGQMGSGMPPEVVLVSFLFSPEFSSFTSAIFGNVQVRPERDAVMDFYRGFLGRLPDDGGFNFWVNRFRTAQCQGAAAVTAEAESISSLFATSSEYATRNRTNAQFVADLYNAFLRRGGDLGGVNFWINQVATGAMTREQVRVQFRGSAEFGARVNAIINAGCSG